MNIHNRNLPQQNGFALHELLPISLAFTALMLVQFAGMARNTTSTEAGQCRVNLRQLIQSWQMYADDYGGELVPAGIGGGTSGKSASNPAWVGGWLDDTSSYDNINYRLLVDNKTHPYGAFLGPYLNQAVTPFKCPSDQSISTIFGYHHSRTRSVSMNNWMNGTAWADFQLTSFVQRNLDDISVPAQRFVITEERNESINDSVFLVDMTSEWIVDYPGIYHASGTFMNFADGHVEFKRWTDPRMVPSVEAGELMPLNVPSAGNADVQWLQERTTDSPY